MVSQVVSTAPPLARTWIEFMSFRPDSVPPLTSNQSIAPCKPCAVREAHRIIESSNQIGGVGSAQSVCRRETDSTSGACAQLGRKTHVLVLPVGQLLLRERIETRVVDDVNHRVLLEELGDL